MASFHLGVPMSAPLTRVLLTAALMVSVGIASIGLADDAPKITRDGPAVDAQGDIKAGDKAPAFTLPTLDGRTVNFPGDFAGQVVIVNFWATWCAPCVEEVPSLERLRRQLKGTPVTVLTVNIDDGNEAEVRALLERSRASFPTALDPGGREALKWGTTKLPETYVVDATGIVREKIIGAQVWDRGDRVAAYRAMASPTP